MMICLPCVPSLAATKRVFHLMNSLRLYMYMFHTWNMYVRINMVLSVPNKHMTRLQGIKRSPLTPVNHCS